MTKEYKINDILSAIDSVSKIQRKKNKEIDTKSEDLTLNNQVNSDKSEILVLNQMIE